ncbi:MAG: TonB-dependent receptor [Steroidobacteraceae bacterium]
MNRSRPKTRRHHSDHNAVLRRLPLASAISAILAGAPLVHAATAPETGGLEEIVVTAQKKSENMQDVPISISVFDTARLEKLNIVNLDDYVKYSPSVSYVRSQGQGGNGQPGTSHIYMRGVVSGGDGNHSGSQPSVGTYFDEQPVTTIDGTPEVHIYDMARIEVLEGPQGTLYGASSEAGTIRLISNKPDPTKFVAGYDVSGSQVQHGGIGYEVEGFVNLPLSPVAAIRLVGWDVKDAGYINNIAGTNVAAGIVNGVRTFPTWNAANGGTGAIGAGSINNAAYIRNKYNTAQTKGGRAALKLDIGDNWSITPTVMGQKLTTEGFFGYDPAVGKLDVTHFGPEYSDDSYVQSALTVEGKVSDFDIVYAGAYMKRTSHSVADYSDYSYFYDKVYGSGAAWVGNNGKPIMPQELVIGISAFEKWSHELRVSTPQQYPIKGTVGVFVQRQLHNILQDYLMPGYGFTSLGGGNPNGFATALSIPGHDNTIWLTDEQRVDRDQAAFAQVTWDITSQWSLSGGLRYFRTDNTLEGFYGYSAAYSPHGSGQEQCFAPSSTVGGPCTNLNNRLTEPGHVPRVNLTYKITPDAMLYATWSKGFRPGGVNRTAAKGIGPYQADFLTNWEVGWKTQWMNHRVRWNGAFFQEDWKNFQFSFLGPNSVTIIENAGNARIRGVENEIEWAVTDALNLSVNFTFLQPRLTSNYCGEADPATGQPATSNPCPAGVAGPVPFAPLAPAGTDLPVTPKFKGNVVARYTFPALMEWKPSVQAAFVYQNRVAPALKVVDANTIGIQPAYGLLDLASGIERNGTTLQLLLTNATDRLAQLTRFEQCTTSVCTQQYAIPVQPRTVTIKFGQRF